MGGERGTLTCSVDDCDRPRRRPSAELCGAHYHRLWRTGSVGSDPIREGGQGCSIADCEGKHYGQGLCNLHWQRKRKWGDPTRTCQNQSGRTNPAWVGDAVTYSGAHMRVRAVRGPASRFACTDCGDVARHWSYDHSDPNELGQLVDGRVLPYSTDVQRYQPRCVQCHKSFDLAHP